MVGPSTVGSAALRIREKPTDSVTEVASFGAHLTSRRGFFLAFH